MAEEKDIKIVVDSFANLIDECLNNDLNELKSSEIEVTITDDENNTKVKKYIPKFILEEIK